MSAEKKNKFRNKPLEDIVSEEKENPFSNVERITEEKSRSRNDIEDVTEKKTKPRNNKPKTEPVIPKKEKISFAQRLEQFKLFYSNERTQRILGMLLIVISGYLAIAFTSYFFTWQVDQDKVLDSAEVFFSPETRVSNWLGKAGALISHFFMYKTFGAASFILVPVILSFAIQKTFQRQFIHIKAFNAKWLFIMTWSSLMLSYIFSDRLYFLGGGFGYFVNAKLSDILGNVGLLVLLAFSMLTFLVLAINLKFTLPQKPVIFKDNETENEFEPQKQKPEFSSIKNEIKETSLTEEEEAALLNFEIIQKGDDLIIAEVDKENTQAFEVITPIDEEKEEKLLLEENKIELESKVQEVKKENNGEPEFEIGKIAEEPVHTDEENKAAQLVEQFGEYDPTLDLGGYRFPEFDLLNDYGNSHTKVNQEELIMNKDRIVGTLKNYGIEIDKITATVGPTVTLYEIVPAAGVRISKIKNLEDDIALSLAALGIRIIAPIPGKGTIGIEVPNQTPEMVPMKNILASEKFNNSNFELPIALGKTISNEIFIADLAKMPHLLMAGATGQGKSVGLNAVLVSLLYKKHPAQVKFVLVDPKKVELTLFNKIERHFLAKLPNSEDAIITDNTKVIHTLNSLCIEMDNRYALLQDAQCRNIKEYNTKFVARKLNPNDGHKFLPYIVLVVDEFADLIMTAGKEVETPIARLAQLARAIGIHLIIATQRPSVNIITGTIKANFPARIAFRVTSKIDSRTILDAGGAEQLIGRGDMLLSTGNDLIRIQCAFVDTPEVEKICEFIGNQRAYPSAFLLPEYVGEDGSDGKEPVDLSERDKMFDEAAKLVVQFQQGSASFLQRKLKLGYNRAGRIVDQLEAAGVIGPFEGSKAREVLVRDMMQLDEILQKLRNH
jgi:DNA segregation ATPase FtsK/SpoIIIE, S-DNA-T family